MNHPRLNTLPHPVRSAFPRYGLRPPVDRTEPYVCPPIVPLRPVAYCSTKTTDPRGSVPRVRYWIISASCGKGKSSFLKQMVSQHFRHPDLRMVSITPRVTLAVGQRALLGQSCGFKSYLDMKKPKDEIPLTPRLICEYESLHHLSTSENKGFDLVICDEARSILQSVACMSTNGENIVSNANIFKEILVRAKAVLFMDADIEADDAIPRMIRTVLGAQPEWVHYERYVTKRMISINVSDSRSNRAPIRPENRAIVFTSDPGYFSSSIETCLRRGECVAVVCSLRRKAHAYAEACVSNGCVGASQVGCYTSDMSGDEVTRVFSDFDRATSNKKLILFTSKVSVGIDASVTRPDRIFIDVEYALPSGREVLQMWYRFRNPHCETSVCLVSKHGLETLGTHPPRGEYPRSDLGPSAETLARSSLDNELESRNQCRSALTGFGSVGMASERGGISVMLRFAIEVARDESNRTFILDLVRLCRMKGITTRIFTPPKKDTGTQNETDVPEVAPLKERSASFRRIRRASSSVRKSDQQFLKDIALEMLSAGACRERMVYLKACVDKCDANQTNRRTRVIQSASDAFLEHADGNVASLARRVFKETGSTKNKDEVKNTLHSTLIKREWSRCFTLMPCSERKGRSSPVSRTVVARKGMIRAAFPEVSQAAAACVFMYQEVVSAHRSSRSMRIQALLRAIRMFPHENQKMKARSSVSRFLYTIDHEACARYGTPSVVKCELAAFREMDELLRSTFRVKNGLLDIASGWSASKSQRSYTIRPFQFEVHAKRICTACSRCRVLIQNLVEDGDYDACSRRDGTTGGPRLYPVVPDRRSVLTPHRESEFDRVTPTMAFDQFNATLFYMYGLHVIPSVCTTRGSGYSAYRVKDSNLTIVCDAVRWTIAEKWKSPRSHQRTI